MIFVISYTMFIIAILIIADTCFFKEYKGYSYFFKDFKFKVKDKIVCINKGSELFGKIGVVATLCLSNGRESYEVDLDKEWNTHIDFPPYEKVSINNLSFWKNDIKKINKREYKFIQGHYI